MFSFQGVEVPVYTKESPFQGVGIEEFHCIQRGPHFRGGGGGGGVGIKRSNCIQRSHHFRVLE